MDKGFKQKTLRKMTNTFKSMKRCPSSCLVRETHIIITPVGKHPKVWRSCQWSNKPAALSYVAVGNVNDTPPTSLSLFSYFHRLLLKLFPLTMMSFPLTWERPNPVSITPTDPLERQSIPQRSWPHPWLQLPPLMAPKSNPCISDLVSKVFTQPLTYTRPWISNRHWKCNTFEKTNSWFCPMTAPNGVFPRQLRTTPLQQLRLKTQVQPGLLSSFHALYPDFSANPGVFTF